MEDLTYWGREMIRRDLTFSTGGNISCRHPQGFAITPGGMDYHTISPEDISVLTLDGEWISGKRPSSEWRLHAEVYRRYPDTEAVVHTHSPGVIALAVCDRSLPPIHYLLADVGGDGEVPVAGYALYGTEELAELTVEAMGEKRAVIMSHHGLIVRGKTVSEAMALAETVEFFAKIHLSVGGNFQEIPMTSDQILEVAEKFRNSTSK